MKIVFLDIDGVLNYSESIGFHLPCIRRLNRIIEKTEAKIVVSSSWRIGITIEYLRKQLKEIQGEIIDRLVHSSFDVPRGCEIEAWLKTMKFQRINYSREEQKRYLEKSEVKNYVILDDDSDMLLSQKEHFVKTSWNTGLLEEHTEQAIKILTTPLDELYYEN